MNTTLGTCSCCGGRVSVPAVWFGVVRPTPTCESCGATAASHGPVVPMKPPGIRDGQTYIIGTGSTASGATISELMRNLGGGFDG